MYRILFFMKLALIGGDARMCAVARLFMNTKGTEVRCFSMPEGAPHPQKTLSDALIGAEAVILPLPASRDGVHPTTVGGVASPTLAEIFSRAEEETLVLGGMLTPPVLAAAGQAEVEIADYYTGEALLLKNAAATAEAAIAMAALDLPVTLAGTTVAVIGSGRIAGRLLPLLRAMGARILLYARSTAGREAGEDAGAITYAIRAGEPPEIPSAVRAVFCTVPAMLFPRGCSLPAAGTLFYDLGGGAIDPEWAKEKGVVLPPSAGLPGRYSPESAGAYLYTEILKLLRMKRGADL